MSDDRTAETTVVSRSPVLGTVVQVSVTAGDRVAVGDTLVVTESMKMEYAVSAGGFCTGNGMSMKGVSTTLGTTDQQV